MRYLKYWGIALAIFASTALGQETISNQDGLHGYIGANIGINANKPLIGIYFKQGRFEFGGETGYIFVNSRNVTSQICGNPDCTIQIPTIIHENLSQGISTLIKASVFMVSQFYLTGGIGYDLVSYTSYNILGQKNNNRSVIADLSYQAGIGYQPVSWLKIEPLYYHNQRGDFFVVSAKLVF